MIVPMLKYSFVVFHKDYDEFIQNLRSVGQFHIKEVNDLPKSTKLAIRDTQQLNEILDYCKVEQDITEQSGRELPSMVTNDWREAIQALEQKEKEIRGLRQEVFLLENTIGKFSSKKIIQLYSYGIYCYLFSCKPNKFDEEWKTKYGAEIVNDSGRKTYFVVFSESDERPDIDAQHELLPGKGTIEIEALKEAKQKEIKELQDQLDFIQENNIHDLQYTINQLNNSIQLDAASSQSNQRGDGSIHYLEAWIPEENSEQVNQILDDHSVYYETSEPDLAEKNPILLNNGNFGKLFEPIGSLFSLPSYAELDLTPLFAPFFTLFFGFCLGDAGYGLLIVLGMTLFGKKLGEQNKGIVRLAQILGLATVVFGVITGTMFGINLGHEDSTLLPLSIKRLFLDSDNLFNLSLAIGGFQIVFGMVVKMANQYKQNGFVYTLSTFGWILLTIGIAVYFLAFPGIPALSTIFAGIALILFFNDPKANILTRFGKGLWELYGITGVFGDLLSYIRLFALGLSSSILGFVINDIGLSFIDSVPILGPILFIIFMIIGHSLNIFIAGLGAFVHPMRLTFVEFYKNAGFAGGGMRYKPFKKEIT
ncbi:MAG: V-type ATP synthase subunit I [Crocinitomicaceae bacterium]|nr:V-type ATP synthase subunit I [Crocinitomicaceae bacterium]|tara:strand:+ start:7652 stop:9427 length:1776 start_codon:yes stop_codon:yes gene_type:complete